MLYNKNFNNLLNNITMTKPMINQNNDRSLHYPLPINDYLGCKPMMNQNNDISLHYPLPINDYLGCFD